MLLVQDEFASGTEAVVNSDEMFLEAFEKHAISGSILSRCRAKKGPFAATKAGSKETGP